MIGRNIRDALSGVAVLVFIGAIGFLAAHCLTGCASTGAASAEAAYTADHLRCVDKSATREESRACRVEVDRRYGIVQTVTDGGAR